MYYLGYWCTTDSYKSRNPFPSNPSYAPCCDSTDRTPLRHHFVAQELFSFSSLLASVPSVPYISLYSQIWWSTGSTSSLGDQKSVKKQEDKAQKSDGPESSPMSWSQLCVLLVGPSQGAPNRVAAVATVLLQYLRPSVILEQSPHSYSVQEQLTKI